MSHGIQKKCMKVPVVEEENSDDDDEDESGELAGVLSLFSCSLFKQYHLKSSVNAMTRQRAHSMTLIHHLQHPGPKFCTGLHRNSMYMICHSNCSTYSPMRNLLHFHLSTTWRKPTKTYVPNTSG